MKQNLALGNLGLGVTKWVLSSHLSDVPMELNSISEEHPLPTGNKINSSNNFFWCPDMLTDIKPATII